MTACKVFLAVVEACTMVPDQGHQVGSYSVWLVERRQRFLVVQGVKVMAVVDVGMMLAVAFLET